MRNRIFVVLAIAVLAGGGLAYGTYNMVNNQPVKTVSTPTQPVVVAASNLQLGAQLKAEDLQVIAFPLGKAPEGTFAQPSEIIGRGLIVPIVKNEPVLKAKLASKEAGSGLPPVIPEGMRAVSVRVDEVVGVAGYVLPGNRVDVLATANPTDQRSDTTTKVILSNVQVLTAGTRMEQDQENTKPVGSPSSPSSSSRSSPSASRWRAPKARFSSRCATRSTRGRRKRPASRPPD